jgi:hypothetical protein
MKPITISRRLKFLNTLLEQARRSNLILQSADGEQFILARITDVQSPADDVLADAHAFTVGESDDFDEEIVATRQNKALMAFLDERAALSQPGRGTSLEEMRRRLGD